MDNLQQSPQEIWKDVKEFEGLYQISNKGQLRKIIGNNEYRMRKPYLMKCGYHRFSLSNKGRVAEWYAHRLVWQHFGSYQEDGIKNHVDHINNIKTDNRIENLQLITARLNNTKDRKRQKLSHHGTSKSAGRYRAVIQVNNKSYQLGTFETEAEAAKEYDRARNELLENGYVSVTTKVYDENMKKCSCCGKVKFNEDFYTNATNGKQRLRSMCIACDREFRKQQRNQKALQSLENKVA
jgi:hypothetical protein